MKFEEPTFQGYDFRRFEALSARRVGAAAWAKPNYAPGGSRRPRRSARRRLGFLRGDARCGFGIEVICE